MHLEKIRSRAKKGDVGNAEKEHQSIDSPLNEVSFWIRGGGMTESS